jgi:hypothetical protein
MLDRPHRVDEVDRLGAQRQGPDVRQRESGPVTQEDRAGLACGRGCDVDSDGPCALLGCPSQDLGAFGFVPQVRLEERAAGEVRKELLEELALAFEIVVGRRRPLEAREVAADLGPK